MYHPIEALVLGSRITMKNLWNNLETSSYRMCHPIKAPRFEIKNNNEKLEHDHASHHENLHESVPKGPMSILLFGKV